MPDNAQILVVDDISNDSILSPLELSLAYTYREYYELAECIYCEFELSDFGWSKTFIILPVRLTNKGHRDLPRDYG